MNVYLNILNWSMLLFVVVCMVMLRDAFGLWFVAGAFLGGAYTAGLVSWRYHKDSGPHRDERWRNSLFSKDYPVEISFLGAMLFLFAVLHWLFARFSFPLGFFSAWILSRCIEWAWAVLVVRRHI